jgi:DNA-directed RNA polymerase specialized sigma24 family protein
MADEGDLSEVPTDELIRLARSATETRRRQEQEVEAAAKRQGAVIGELVKRPGWTYAKVATLLEIDDSTVHRIVKRAQTS